MAFSGIHAPRIECLSELTKSCRGELGDTLLKDCKYAFQLFDIQIIDPEPDPFTAAATGYTTPPCIVRMFGVDADGRSVMVQATGFHIPLFFELPWVNRCGTRSHVLKRLMSEIVAAFRGRDPPPFEVDLISASRLGGYVPGASKQEGIGKKTFARLRFPVLANFCFAQGVLKRAFPNRIAEETVALSLKVRDYFRQRDGVEVEACGWVGVKMKSTLSLGIDGTPSLCDVEIGCTMADLVAIPEINRLAPILVASYDIECISPSGLFPDPRKAEDRVTVIGTTYRRIGTAPHRDGAPYIGGTVRTSHVLGTCDPVEGCIVNCHATEIHLMGEWAHEFAQIARADCLISYNGLSFDNKFLVERAKYDSRCRLLYLSKLRDIAIKPRMTKLSSKAMGDNEVYRLPMVGRFELDMYHWIKNRLTHLKSLKLDDVAKEYLGEQKVALPISAIGVAFGPKGTPALRAEVVRYCATDCDLPLRLAEHLHTIEELSEMARVCHTLLPDMLSRGEQIKVFSGLLMKAHHDGCILTDSLPPVEEIEGKYTGATVLDPRPGFYNDLPVVTLDFASLYPSIMRSENLCFSTFVDPKATLPPWVETKTFELAPGRTATFVTSQTHRGVLPRLLEDLLAARKATRKQLKALPPGSPERQLLDGRQLAYKICANSVYGFTGANKGMYPLKVIAETTTCRGREMIGITKHLMETRYNADVIYGDTDSVMVIFPLDKHHASGDTKTEDELIRESFVIGEDAAKVATCHFGDCNELECEKTSLPYLLFGKKTYCARVFESPGAPPKLDIKGLAVVRRDCCNWVAHTLKHTLDALIMQRSVETAKDIVVEALRMLVEDEVPLDELTLSKRLSGSYASDRLPQLTVVKKMEERNPGSAPKSGDRVAYVICQTANRDAKVFEKAECVDFVADPTNGARIDKMHYLVRELQNPVLQLFEPFEKNPRMILDPARFEIERRQSGHTTIVETDWRVPKSNVPRVTPEQPKKKRRQTTLAF